MVVGNFIFNMVIVVMSVIVLLELVVVLFIFLVVVYKLEYFVNVCIIGSCIDVCVWELIFVLIVMEVLFGLGGVIVVLVVYVYMKCELMDVELIG